eukprot:PhM_4_TR14692/c1_g1_i3/m.68320
MYTIARLFSRSRESEGYWVSATPLGASTLSSIRDWTMNAVAVDPSIVVQLLVSLAPPTTHRDGSTTVPWDHVRVISASRAGIVVVKYDDPTSTPIRIAASADAVPLFGCREYEAPSVAPLPSSTEVAPPSSAPISTSSPSVAEAHAPTSAIAAAPPPALAVSRSPSPTAQTAELPPAQRTMQVSPSQSLPSPSDIMLLHLLEEREERKPARARELRGYWLSTDPDLCGRSELLKVDPFVNGLIPVAMFPLGWSRPGKSADETKELIASFVFAVRGVGESLRLFSENTSAHEARLNALASLSPAIAHGILLEGFNPGRWNTRDGVIDLLMAEIQRVQDTHIRRALMAAVTPAHLFSTALFARLAKGESEKHANVRMSVLPWEKTAKPMTSTTTTSPSPAPKPQPRSKKYFVTTTPAQGVEDSNLSSSQDFPSKAMSITPTKRTSKFSSQHLRRGGGPSRRGARGRKRRSPSLSLSCTTSSTPALTSSSSSSSPARSSSSSSCSSTPSVSSFVQRKRATAAAAPVQPPKKAAPKKSAKATATKKKSVPEEKPVAAAPKPSGPKKPDPPATPPRPETYAAAAATPPATSTTKTPPKAVATTQLATDDDRNPEHIRPAGCYVCDWVIDAVLEPIVEAFPCNNMGFMSAGEIAFYASPNKEGTVPSSTLQDMLEKHYGVFAALHVKNCHWVLLVINPKNITMYNSLTSCGQQEAIDVANGLRSMQSHLSSAKIVEGRSMQQASGSNDCALFVLRHAYRYMLTCRGLHPKSKYEALFTRDWLASTLPRSDLVSKVRERLFLDVLRHLSLKAPWVGTSTNAPSVVATLPCSKEGCSKRVSSTSSCVCSACGKAWCSACIHSSLRPKSDAPWLCSSCRRDTTRKTAPSCGYMYDGTRLCGRPVLGNNGIACRTCKASFCGSHLGNRSRGDWRCQKCRPEKRGADVACVFGNCSLRNGLVSLNAQVQCATCRGPMHRDHFRPGDAHTCRACRDP